MSNTNKEAQTVNSELDTQIENILDDFGHEVVNNPGSSRRSLQATPKRLLKNLHVAHLQAAEIDFAKEVYAKFASYKPEEFETFLRMKAGSQLNQGDNRR